jgi:hypothetical protein
MVDAIGFRNRIFRKNPISSLGRKLLITSHLVLLEQQLSVPIVDLAEDIRSRYLAFLSEAIWLGLRAMLEHLEGPVGAAEDDKYRLGKSLEMLDLFKDQTYRYVRYY